MQNEIKLFGEACKGLSDHVASMIDLEHEKRQALLSHHLETIERLVQRQQAMIMKLEGLEKKRTAAQQNAGLGNFSSSKILSEVDLDSRAFLQPIFQNLNHSIDTLQQLNQVSADIASTELRMLNEPFGAFSQDGHGLYQADGKRGGNPLTGAALEEKI